MESFLLSQIAGWMKLDGRMFWDRKDFHSVLLLPPFFPKNSRLIWKRKERARKSLSLLNSARINGKPVSVAHPLHALDTVDREKRPSHKIWTQQAFSKINATRVLFLSILLRWFVSTRFPWVKWNLWKVRKLDETRKSQSPHQIDADTFARKANILRMGTRTIIENCHLLMTDT